MEVYTPEYVHWLTGMNMGIFLNPKSRLWGMKSEKINKPAREVRVL
jgi:hypothetical protein